MLRPLGNNLGQTQGMKRISPDEWKKKIEGANLQATDSEPKTIDPLTGKMITAAESKQKYGDGKKLIYVKIEGDVHYKTDGSRVQTMGKIERITVAEYQRRYYDYAEPPKAAESIQELTGFNAANLASMPEGKYKTE